MNISVFATILSVIISSKAMGASFFVTVPVQAPTDQDAMNAQAPTAAGLLLVRHNIPGESAVQLAGPDGPGPGRIFTRPGTGSYGLTDAGSQWSTAVNVGQTVLGLVETYPGQFGWTGKPFVGAFSAIVTKDDLVASRLAVSPCLMMEVPAVKMASASESAITITVSGAVDSTGLLQDWVLWRKIVGNSWEKVVVLPLTPSAQSYADSTVSSGLQYIYGVSGRFTWPGGGQAGALPAESGTLTSFARSESGSITASKDQPTPTAIPSVQAAAPTPNLGSEAWLAYPNPNRDGMLHLVFQTTKQITYELSVFSIDGTKVAHYQGKSESLGWQQPVADLRKLASGIYLLHLQTEDEAGTKYVLPLRKLAIVR